jgi:hypothetical protein
MYLQMAYHTDISACVVPCVHTLDRVSITVGKRLGSVKSAVLVEECVLHADIVFIINTIVMNMFLALKDIGVFVLDGEPAHGQ